ncbi:hypothetical protein QBC38DRAFT_359012 [Podospora fimiseda]|uniref:Uncharacterized protein n=1 Tax=Podospora fimiseda TaxID=252190 RepID=A0AAN7BU75_9PEZI|nr:hypothetical protein QBC38DRAFT_359012 [Podospora fimiseda]
MTSSSAAPVQGTIPTLSEPASESGGTTPRADSTQDEKKPKRRSIFGFGKKKEAEGSQAKISSTTPSSISRTTPAAPLQTEGHHNHYITPSSPGRPFASSPRLSSPAGSQIFERDVQESAAAVMPNSPAIPSHIQTENFIPPVLDASSEAITDSHLDPDNVEIVTHQRIYSEPSWTEELAAFSLDKGIPATNTADSASNYGNLDNTDVRRLSFISFAEMVQAEQASTVVGNRESMHIAGLTSLNIHGNNRSPSPIRSPVSSVPGSSSPPSVKGLDVSAPGSPPRGIVKPLGSPTSLVHGIVPSITGPTVSGELAIETMSQALRRTGSGDLRGGLGHVV